MKVNSERGKHFEFGLKTLTRGEIFKKTKF